MTWAWIGSSAVTSVSSSRSSNSRSWLISPLLAGAVSHGREKPLKAFYFHDFRIKTHVSFSLSKHDAEVAELPLDLAASLQGTCIQISPDRIYDELVPFGRAYRNLCDKLIISPDGALAAIRSPEIEPEGPLGSPFPLDAAFHAACVWAQRYSGVVAFPVGLDHRVVVSPACPGQRYFSRLVLIHTAADVLIFDIWIYDSGGRLCELAAGVRMRDVSGGRLQPPEWIRGGKV